MVPSFVLGDPWSVLRAAAVPFWTFFPVRPALEAYEQHLEAVDAYRNVDVLLFNHGVRSDGAPAAQEWLDLARRHGARARLVGVRGDRFPADIASLARYGPALAALPAGARPWSPLPIQAVAALPVSNLPVSKETQPPPPSS